MIGRYVVVAAEYEPNATDVERSLGWLVAELADAGLAMTESTPGVRKWDGVIDGEIHRALADVWDLEHKASQPDLGMVTKYGHLAGDCYTFDGMEWELSGWSPIVWVSLFVSEPIEREPNFIEHDLPFVYVG